MSLNTLKELAHGISDRNIRKIVLDILENPVLGFTDVKPLIRLEDSPAAPRKHHFFTGGLIVHTYSVAKIALALADIIEEVYGVNISKDVILAAAILHDVFKYYQYTPDRINGGYRAREDWYLSHDYAIVAELSKRGAPEKLIRAVSEAHGQVLFSTMEGFVVHLADSVDARFGEIIQNILLSKVKEYEKTCTVYKALDYVLMKHGIRNMLQLAFHDVDSFKRVFEDVCKEMQSNDSALKPNNA
ncbi:MAG: HDIG domain-containing protein [Desulfurococcaceae archaeon]